MRVLWLTNVPLPEAGHLWRRGLTTFGYRSFLFEILPNDTNAWFLLLPALRRYEN